jgi:hypothetical protein
MANHQSSPRFRKDVLDRKMSLANGVGTVMVTNTSWTAGASPSRHRFSANSNNSQPKTNTLQCNFSNQA